MSKANRYPFDYDALETGQTIPAARIEEITGVKRNSADYALKVMAIQKRIEQELAARNKFWTVVSSKGDIKILTDAEASTYHYVGAERDRQSERRHFAMSQAVDSSQLSDEQREQHRHRLVVQGRFIQAQEKVRKQFRMEANKRNVPGLPPAEAEASSHDKVINGESN